MPGRIFTEKEKVKPDKVFATTTEANFISTISPDVELVFEGDEGLKILQNWIKESKSKGRDFTIKCGKITFKNRS